MDICNNACGESSLSLPGQCRRFPADPEVAKMWPGTQTCNHIGNIGAEDRTEDGLGFGIIVALELRTE